ncbi:MAG: long-chain fatty acid--CoA ligase [Proteobacteria bacterium]|nr:long-chain fatty acid--CoA ligase [Pseudomonadota bacterium]
MNFSMLLDMAADACGERIAVSCAGQQLTYAELRRAARAAAPALAGGGFAHAAFLDTNGLAAPVALFAAAYAGVPYVPLNYRLTAPELEELLARVAPAWLVSQPQQLSRLKLPAGIVSIEAAALLAPAREPGPAEAPDLPGAVAILLFTSGTTAKPKAAVLRHDNVMSYILGSVEFGAAGEEEAALVSVPPYHIAGISAVLSSTYATRRIVMLPSFEPGEWLRLVAQERITHAFLVPTMLVRVMEHLALHPAGPFPALRAIAYGGGKMPLAVIGRALEAFPNVDFTNAYGLTETSATVCLLTPEDHRTAAASPDAAIRRRLGSVGRPLPTVELQIRDAAGAVLGAQEPGFVYVRGPQVSGEYRGLGSLLDAQGWFATQDRGWVDAEGYLFLDGRADDVIVRGGENISPGEVEEALLGHAAVADAVVVAIPSEQWGEAVAAAVVLKAGMRTDAQALQQWVRERLRSSRVPERVRFVSELPYNEMGKVLRRVVRSEMADEDA